MRRVIGLAVLSLLSLAVLGPGSTGRALAETAAPSFDCSKATEMDEKAICARPDLAKLDAMIAAAFKTYKPEFRRKLDVAHDLNAERRACAGNLDCILLAQAAALDTYGGLTDWVKERRAAALLKDSKEIGDKMGGDPTPPDRIGECSATTITQLGTRLGEGDLQSSRADENRGSVVQFGNGLTQISYERESALVASHKGDPVIVCLALVPHDCPANDTRGRFYFVLNQRTQQTWMLADSSHMCGGA